MGEKTACEISEDEAALYDRQIRLWGLDAQKRLRSSRVLLVGLGGLGAEVCKNVLLSGVKSMTLLDDCQVTNEDLCSNFFLRREDLGKNRAECARPNVQLLNPMVEVTADTTPLAEKDIEFFSTFDAICATCCKQSDLIKLDEVCREKKILFFSGDVVGFYGVSFTDLGEHDYVEEVQRRIVKATHHHTAGGHGDGDHGDGDHGAAGEPANKKQKTDEMETVSIKKTQTFTSLKSAFDVDWSKVSEKTLKTTPDTFFIYKVLLKFRDVEGRDPLAVSREDDRKVLQRLRDEAIKSLKISPDQLPEGFDEYCFAEISPVCAITGGILGQEVIKALSKKDKPHNNFFLYNGVSGNGMVDMIGH